MHRALFVVPWLVFAVPAAAQIPFTVSGRVVAAPAGACNPAATHAIECTGLLLRSMVVDLGQHAGNVVRMEGTLGIAIGCLTLDVAAVDARPGIRLSSFSLANYRIGTTMSLLSRGRGRPAVSATSKQAAPALVPQHVRGEAACS